ncbi:hypothetical protein [Piscirickettsia salmonis]|uniref:hypothetical protein n=1 Tax=Piscirickettsia salmonis TaxID=1238 RepID=UPI0012BB167C|nr:hypothetical protein [Piscirickettsia salmonis]QGP62087.1 hypothetical protein PsalBI1_04729 [Piscirickettsia salmonis]
MKTTLNLGELPTPKGGFSITVEGLGELKIAATGLSLKKKGKSKENKVTWKKLATLLDEGQPAPKKASTKKVTAKPAVKKKVVAKKSVAKKPAKKVTKSTPVKKTKTTKKTTAKKK